MQMKAVCVALTFIILNQAASAAQMQAKLAPQDQAAIGRQTDAQTASPQPEKLGTYTGPGAIDGAVVGPGPTPGSERLYLAYMYMDRTIDLVAIDPANGRWQSFANPAKSEYGAIMTLGPDGNLYLGTRPHAHVYKLNTRTGEYQDLGQPIRGEQYVYGLVAGSDGMMYGCTYPSAKMFRFSLATDRFEDLGRMDPKEAYGRFIAASRDGFVYEGIGTAQAHLVAYEIASGKHRDILPESLSHVVDPAGDGSMAVVHQGDDGNIYATVGKHSFIAKGWTLHEIPESEVRPAASQTRLKNGSVLTVDGNQILIQGPGANELQRLSYTYPGLEGTVFRIGAGPDGHIYGSSILPFHLFDLDVDSKRIQDLGSLGHGEAYSLVSSGDSLYLAVYGGEAKTPLMVFQPSRRFSPGVIPGSNPLFVTYSGADTGWRPEAMVMASDGKFYIGSIAGYGSIDGPLTVFDPRTNQTERINGIVPGQSIVSLASIKDLLVGGTTIYGGGGSHPSQREAKLLLWSMQSRQKTFETVPVQGASAITDILELQNGKVMGVAAGIKPDGASSTGSTERLFVFDLRSHTVDYSIPLEMNAITNSVAVGPDGAVWGLATEGIFRFDPKSRSVELRVKTPVTAGFALLNGSLYYSSGPTVFRYRLPLSTEAQH